jgi:hypothetical protein
MNPRSITGIIGALTAALGVLALISPTIVMQRVVGFAVEPSFSENFVRGEVRAVYGGLFGVLGVLTLLSAMDLAMHRSRVLLIGLLWLGACGGRLVGVTVDGSPGLLGWLSVAVELVVGGTLVAISMTAPAPPATPSVSP